MSDRFDFLELGDAPRSPQPPPPLEEPAYSPSPGWKPLRLRTVEQIGERGTGAGEFATPTGLATDNDGALYVADSNNHRVQRIAMNGDVRVYGRPGNGSGQLWGPQAVAVSPNGQFLFVADQGNHRVQCFRIANGQPWGFISDFRAPSSLAFDAEGKLWIADTGNQRVLRLDTQTGQFYPTILSFKRPTDLAADPAHHIWVTDSVLSDVACYGYTGQLFGSLGANRRIADPRQVAIDREGRLYVTEAGADRLHIFARNGDSLLTYESPSTRLGPLRTPSGVALGPNGEIYLADTLNHRIFRLAWE